MELSYNTIKKMDVVNVSDGKHLGRVCDIIFCFPENKLQGFYVTGCKGFRFTKQDIFLPVSAIVRVGEDVILTDFRECEKPDNNPGRKSPEKLQPCRSHGEPRRDYGEYG